MVWTRPLFITAVCLAASMLLFRAAMTAEPPDKIPSAQNLEFFEKQVRPILVRRCHECHAGEEHEGGLRLDGIATILAGGDTGPAIVPGKPDESLLVEAIGYGPDSYQMPPPGKLPEEEIAVLNRWVELGAPWPNEETATTVKGKEFDLVERARHWSFQPLVDHAPPDVKEKTWPQSPIDQFILARLEAAGISPASPADRRALIRRVTFDLIGLPPSPEEIEAFLADESPDAFATVVDGLLASPHYGERWARHWLDLVRFAESRGHEFDYDVANAYQYRDYVIRALNADVPYDRFVMEHIAGDLLPDPRMHPAEGYNESILGTGFWFLGEWCHSPVDVRKDETDRQDNMIDVMSKTFLGLTVACARCHDHKFDAIRQRDYYALAGYLQSSTYRQARFESLDHNRRIAAELEVLRHQHRGPILKAVGESFVRELADFDKYLLATLEFSADDNDVDMSLVTACAEQKGLDAGKLRRLVEHLRAAIQEEDDPLHGWALACGSSESDATDRQRVARALKPLLESLDERRAKATAMLDDALPVFEFADATGAEWIQDGYTFGPGPHRPGDVTWSDDPQRPIARVSTAGAAVRDPAWDGLRIAAGTQQAPGLQEKIPLAGRTIRTPTFSVKKRYVCCLVEGPAQAYVVVDSHRMNEGPLHGRLIAKTDGDQPGPRWIASDLRLCQGRDAHVEFTPVDDRPLAVYKVVQCDEPPDYASSPNDLLTVLIRAASTESPERWAAGLRQLFVETAEQLARDEIVGSQHAADRAALADWLVQNVRLFSVRADAPDSEVAAAAAPLIQRQRELIDNIRNQSRTAMAMLDGWGEDEWLLIRGNHRTPGERVPRRFLETLAGAEQPPLETGSGRLELARRIADVSNPLTARVMVNRLWQHHFGRGIVGSPDNFGRLGQPPTHPELLDYLAAGFIESGWSLKQMHRRMLLTSTYQMSSTAAAAAEEADPANKLWHRMPVRRLEAEAVRDAVLAVSGRLDPTLYGPSVPTHLTPFMTGRGRPKESGPLDGDGRRSIYIAVRRNFLTPMFLAFDFPAPFSTMGRRTESNVPAQALTMMNNPLVVEQAHRWAERLLAREGMAPRDRIEAMYLEAFARPPTTGELDAALVFLRTQENTDGGEDLAAWSDLCHVLLNTKEFIFVR